MLTMLRSRNTGYSLSVLWGILLVSQTHCSNFPQFDHIVIVVEENHSFNQIIGSDSAPYINYLAQNGALFTQSKCIQHPSQPNYLALFSGSTQGVWSDSEYPKFSTPNLAQALLAVGKTFIGYSEDLPYTGFDGESSGSYARKHNPWTQFTNVPESLNQPFTSFPTDFSQLPSVSFVIPNLNNDAHDGSVSQADTWLKNNLGAYAEWAKTNNSLLIITFDENAYLAGDTIPTLFYGAHIKPGKYAEAINHYNVLRTVEDIYGLPYAGQSAEATPITDVWDTTTTQPTFTSSLTQTGAGQVTANFTPTGGWTSSSVNLTYQINTNPSQTVPLSDTNNAWQYILQGLNNGDKITYTFTYAWQGQSLQTATATYTYTDTNSSNFSQNITSVGDNQVRVSFTSPLHLANVLLHYSINGQTPLLAIMTQSGDTWNYTFSGINKGDTIHYEFTWLTGTDTSWFTYTSGKSANSEQS